MTRWIQGAFVLAAGTLLTFPKSAAAQDSARQVSQTTSVSAAAPTLSDADIETLRAEYRDQRKEIVATNMSLTADEATKFWPLYDEYTTEVRKNNDKRYAMIREYAASHASMTDQQAKDHVKKSIEVDAEKIELRERYIPKFEKLVGPKKAAQFYQIDRRLDLLMNLQLTQLLPLVEPTK